MACSKRGIGATRNMNTALFDEAVSAFQSVMNDYQEVTKKVISSSDLLLEHWEGHGRDSFSRKYTILSTELKDECDNFLVIVEDLEDARLSYEQINSSLSKAEKAKNQQ